MSLHIFNSSNQSTKDIVITSLVIIAIICFLPFKTISSGIAVGLSIYSAFDLIFSKKNKPLVVDKLDIVIMFILASPFLAILISQSLRQDWIMNAYDGPSRLLACIFLYLYLKKNKSQITKFIPLACTIAIILTALYLIAITQVRDNIEINLKNLIDGHRLTLSHIDPIIFGNCIAILISMSLIGLWKTDAFMHKSWSRLLWGMAILIGLVMLILSQSRSSMIIMITSLAIAFLIHSKKISIGQLLKGVFFISLTVLLAYKFIPIIEIKVDQTLYEVSSWISGVNRETSAGIRLSMWLLSWELFLNSPLVGYGDKNFDPSFLSNTYYLGKYTLAAVNTLYCCGPHNEFFANIVRSGIWGGLSFFCIYILTSLILIHRVLTTPSSAIHQLGLIFVLSFFIGGLFGELLSMKFMYSFFGLLLTVILAESNHEQR